jgi:hypothetical protein
MNGPDAGFPGTGDRLNSQVGFVLCLIAAIIVVVLLTGCAIDPALVSHAPSIAVHDVVAVRCVKPEEIPALPKTAMPAAGDVGQNAAGAKADIINYKDELKRAIVVMKRCVIDPAAPPPAQATTEPAKPKKESP